jgi:valyl-tRNA synthetase
LLKKQNKIVKIEKKEHEYPFCYRCDTPLFYKAMPALFVNIDKIRKNKVRRLPVIENQKIIVQSTRDFGGIIAINDSTYDFNSGDIVEVRLSDKPLKVIELK